MKVDQANVEATALNVAYCHIDAPASGLAGQLLVDAGNYVQAGGGTTLVTITQIKPIYVSFSVPEETLDEVRRHQAESPLEVDAYSQAGKLLEKGKLTLVNNQANTATGTVTLEGAFDNPDETLWPGRFVSVDLIIDVRKNAVTVPQQTVMSGPNGSYVYVIEPNDVVRRVPVEVAARQSGVAVIASGLSGGEQVVTAGQSRLGDNVRVRIKAPAARPAKSCRDNERFRDFHSTADRHRVADGGRSHFRHGRLRAAAGRCAAQYRFSHYRGHREVARRQSQHHGGDDRHSLGGSIRRHTGPRLDVLDQRPRADDDHVAIRSQPQHRRRR